MRFHPTEFKIFSMMQLIFLRMQTPYMILILPMFMTLPFVEASLMTYGIAPQSTEHPGSGGEEPFPEPPYILVHKETETGVPTGVKAHSCHDNRLAEKQFYQSLKAMRAQLDILQHMFTQCCLGCPTGYFFPPGGSQCYRVSTEERSWWQAQQICQSEGSNLLSLQTAFEEFTITNYLSQNKDSIRFPLRFYTNGNELTTKGVWQWGLGDAGEVFTHTNWGVNEPNDSELEREECVEYNYSYGWNDVPCYLPLRYICERDMVITGGHEGHTEW